MCLSSVNDVIASNVVVSELAANSSSYFFLLLEAIASNIGNICREKKKK